MSFVLEVVLNDGAPIRVGLESAGALVATLNADVAKEDEHIKLELNLGGLSYEGGRSYLLKWQKQPLRLGDVLKITIGSEQAPDPPLLREDVTDETEP